MQERERERAGGSGRLKKRWIGVIPPHPVRHKRYLEDLRQAILPAGRIIPATVFYHTSYEQVQRALEQGFAFDLLLAARQRDFAHPEVNNVAETVRRLREAGRRTVFVLSFNEVLARLQGLDAAAEKEHLRRLIELAAAGGEVNGVIWTSSTEPLFLLSLIGDVLDDPSSYLLRRGVYQVESQIHFLNHPPEHTLVGIKQ